MTLSSRERVLRAIRREPTDCVVAAPYIYDLAAVVAGISVRDFCHDAHAMVKAQLALQEIVGQDVIAVGSDNYYIAEGFGCRTTTEEDEIPALDKPAAAQLTDVFDLQVPDPTRDGRMPLMLEAIRLVRKAVGDQVQAWLCEVGFAEAGMPEANQAALHHALDLATEALIRFGKACWDAGADIIHCGDSLASCDVISPASYRRYAFPYQQRVFAAWKEHGIDGSLLHICGDSSKVLEAYADTGADLIEIDNKVDLALAKERIGGRVTLMGNVHTVEHLLKGTVQCVRDASQKCIDKAGSGGGFILGSGCIVPRRTPVKNVVEMVRVAHQQPYP
jgi:uroporphyrinogen decarboxylase